MDKVSTQTPAAIGRSQGLCDLVRAIDKAQWLAWRLGAVEGRNIQALELYVRLEAVRLEIEALREGTRPGPAGDDFGDDGGPFMPFDRPDPNP